jgi:hypothetical protein
MSWQPPPPPPRGQNPGHPGQPQPDRSQTLYDILQVTPNAHPTIIRYSYRYLAGIYHPDNHETGSTEAFRLISEAFKTLSDSGKRAAYDAQLGPMLKKEADIAAAAAAASGQTVKKPFEFEKTSLSYNEIELRLAILQLLLQARKKRVQTGGCSAKVLMDVLGVEMGEMEFALWYLREKGYAERQEAQFMITVSGVDYIVDSLTKTQIIDEGPKSVPNYKPGGSSANLPAPPTR